MSISTPQFSTRQLILSVNESILADSAAISQGIDGIELMERAGAGVANTIIKRWLPCHVLVLCGPGNNGGDGFVAARLLHEAGWPVRLTLLGSVDELKGEAKLNAARWPGTINALAPDEVNKADLIIDAIFGVGLSRPLQGIAAKTLIAIGDKPCVAVDVPSGIDGDSGSVLGVSAVATVTVTFGWRKPGHLLMPGRAYCGEVVVVDIGIPESVVEALDPQQSMNYPTIWEKNFPWPRLEQHKYSRGYAVIAGGSEMPGAATLAARSAQRIGAGIVALACASDAVSVYRTALISAVVRVVDDTETFIDLLNDPRTSAWLIGPGVGKSEQVRERVIAGLLTGKPAILDADALTVFEDSADLLFKSIVGPCLLTPHEGEFRKLFRIEGDKISRVRKAAQDMNCVILLKGPDTVIAHPDGRVVINSNGPADLATAGSGDVLAGLATGLIAQNMDPYYAACAAVWLHGASAHKFGPGLVAEDLVEQLPSVLKSLKSRAYFTQEYL